VFVGGCSAEAVVSVPVTTELVGSVECSTAFACDTVLTTTSPSHAASNNEVGHNSTADDDDTDFADKAFFGLTVTLADGVECAEAFVCAERTEKVLAITSV